MTLSGWLVYICFAIILAGMCALIGYSVNHIKLGVIVGAILCVAMLGCFIFYYQFTAAGKRAYKTQESNLSNGINREVVVYDMEGEVIKEYKGKFDITYDNDRILFDDEEGKRHIIYYPTGTVTIDEY